MSNLNIRPIAISVFLLLIVFFISADIVASDITRVTVRDNQFEIVRELTGSEDLRLFTELWNTKHEVILMAMPHWTHKINIMPGGRWLYHPNGFTMLLSKQATGIFKIDESEKFNELLSINGKD